MVCVDNVAELYCTLLKADGACVMEVSITYTIDACWPHTYAQQLHLPLNVMTTSIGLHMYK